MAKKMKNGDLTSSSLFLFNNVLQYHDLVNRYFKSDEFHKKPIKIKEFLIALRVRPKVNPPVL